MGRHIKPCSDALRVSSKRPHDDATFAQEQRKVLFSASQRAFSFPFLAEFHHSLD